MFMEHIGQRIKRERELLGLTQVELARQSGVAQSTIGGLESQRNPGSAHTAQIAKALGVNPLWLATGIGEKRNDEMEIVQIWHDLDKERQGRLIATARDLRTAQFGVRPSAKNPFANAPSVAELRKLKQ